MTRPNRHTIKTRKFAEAFCLVIFLGSCAASDFSGTTAEKAKKSDTKKSPSTVSNGDPDTFDNATDPATPTKPGTVTGPDDTIITATGETIKKIVIGEEGDCSLVSNLLENPDFEKGNTGFTSYFAYDGSCLGRYSPRSALHYSVNSTPNTCHVGYASSTGDKGQMLVVNMPAAGQNEKRFWCQTVNVKAGKTYRLSARLRAAVPSAVDSQPTFVAFTIDGSEVMATFKLQVDWKEHRQVSVPKTSGNIVFCGESRTQNTESTDLIADDFSFGECKEP